MASKRRKARVAMRVLEGVWRDAHWSVKFGELKRRRGRPHQTLFKAVGEKLPYESLNTVRKHITEELAARGRRETPTGLYVAHDSMGIPRYIGRGNIFNRLATRKRGQPHELVYFSFYVVQDRTHEGEIETLLIRAAGPSLHFNQKKKRVDIEPGSVRDYEAGTCFFVRQRKKGRKRRQQRLRSGPAQERLG